MNSSVSFHPQDDMLLDFSSGRLDDAPAMCISAHLHFCERCRSRVNQLTELGSEVFSKGAPVTLEHDALDKLFARIDSSQEYEVGDTHTASASTAAKHGIYPHVVEKLLSNEDHKPRWRNVSSSLKVARLFTGQNKFEVALHRIKAGGVTPIHNHGGKEYTVVLSGSFSDENGVYNEGDFILKEAGDIHHPVGAKYKDCVCLTALEAPIELPGILGWLMKPILRIHPA